MRALLGGLVIATLGLYATGIASATSDYSKTVGGYTIYLGVLPAGVLFLYRPDHGDAKMHDGPRFGDAHHVLVGLVDAASGVRIGDAEVTARITPAKGQALEKRLERMSVDKTVAYGGFFPLRRDHRYRIDLTIRRPGSVPTVDASFDYTHRL
jgi:hypothetical protein